MHFTMIKNRIVATLLVALLAYFPVTAQQPMLSSSDLTPLIGGEWTGELTYLDYGSGKRTSIRSNLVVTQASDPLVWNTEYLYPDEPKANSKSTIGLSKDGLVFNDQRVTVKNRSQDGGLTFVTEKEGTDNGKKALFRYTYRLSPVKFSIRKEVRIEGGSEFFERNTYSWARK